MGIITKINLKQVQTEIFSGLRKKMDDIGYMIDESAKEKCHVRSGILRNSIEHEVNETHNKITLEIGSAIDYAPYHHDHNPYLQDALDENLDNIKSKLGDNYVNT